MNHKQQGSHFLQLMQHECIYLSSCVFVFCLWIAYLCCYIACAEFWDWSFLPFSLADRIFLFQPAFLNTQRETVAALLPPALLDNYLSSSWSIFLCLHACVFGEGVHSCVCMHFNALSIYEWKWVCSLCVHSLLVGPDCSDEGEGRLTFCSVCLVDILPSTGPHPS